MNIIKRSEKNNINHMLRKCYHIDSSQKSKKFQKSSAESKNFILFVIFEKKNFSFKT